MQVELTEDLVGYQQRVRAHIHEHRPPMNRLPGTRSPKRDELPAYKRWCASLFDAGFIGADWPTEWGGRDDHDSLQDFVLDTELATARAPRPIGAYNLISGAVLKHGTEEQKSRILPRIRSFDDLWCQLFSEPEAGSDLASLRTKAVREGDEWVVTGQKVWTTHAHIADFGFLLARTDPTAPKHSGISAFVVDMRSPGLEVRPLREITGSSDFNEVFFDNVRIPATNMIGAPGEGWAIARTALAHERSQSQREDSISDAVRQLARFAETHTRDGVALSEHGDVRRTIGKFFARAEVSDLLGFKGLLKNADGVDDVADSPVSKVVFTEANLAIAEYALELQGELGVLDSPDERVLLEGHPQEAYLYARGFTISAGSNEIMKNIISERALKLPRDPAKSH